MANFVYTLVYDEDGDFLIFLKQTKSYFFGGTGRGAVFKDGTPIVNGPGSLCFPGGKNKGRWENNNIITNARREFVEECGRSIEFEDGAGEIEIPYAHTVEKFVHNKSTNFAGYYVQVAPYDLSNIFGYLVGTSLLAGAQAAIEIRKGTITEYSQIEDSFPNAPIDDELKSVEIWSLEDNGPDINALRGKQDTGWFYTMIMELPRLISE